MKALILVDIQNDFLPGGALAVPEGHAVIPVANRAQADMDLVVATQDWHPLTHKSFAANNEGAAVGEMRELSGLPQVMWPAHCVQGSPGAAFAEDLQMHRVEAIFRKGTDVNIDSYSGFFDNGRKKSTGLGDYLLGKEVTDVYVLGLATDYCVKFTALDAVDLGFSTHLLAEGCRGVNLSPGDDRAAIEEMQARGVRVSD